MSTEWEPPEGFVPDDLFNGTAVRRLRRRGRPHIAFADRTRRQQRRMAVRISWRIKQDPNGLGLFTTHQVLPGSAEWPMSEPGPWATASQWADFYVMSQRPLRQAVFFNCVATTVAMETASRLEKDVEDSVLARVAPEDLPLTRLTVYSRRTRTGSEMIFAPARPIPSLGGLLLDQARAAAMRTRLTQPIVACPIGVTLDHDYSHGVGAHMICDVRSIDLHSLPLIIADFRARGEQSFTDVSKNPLVVRDVRAMLEAKMWQWNASVARQLGHPIPPDPSNGACMLMGSHSAAVRVKDQ